MNPITEQLLDAALALPEEARIRLVKALIISLRSDGKPPFDDSWREVILRRSSELQSGQVAPISWAEVKQLAREKLRSGFSVAP